MLNLEHAWMLNGTVAKLQDPYDIFKHARKYRPRKHSALINTHLLDECLYDAHHCPSNKKEDFSHCCSQETKQQQEPCLFFVFNSFLYDTLNLEPHQVMKGQQQDCFGGGQITLLDHGVLRYRPKQHLNANYVVISAGIHGDETAPLEIMDTMVADILSGSWLPTQHILFIIANPKAIKKHQRFVDENLNRLFDKKVIVADNIEGQIARRLKHHMKDFYQPSSDMSSRWHFDLHCSMRHSKHYIFAVSPKVNHPVRSRALIDMLQAGGVSALMLSTKSSSTFSWFSAERFGAQAVTVELGRVNRLQHNDLHRLEPFTQALRASLAGRPYPQPCLASQSCTGMVIYRVNRTITRTHHNFTFNFASDIPNFSPFMYGVKLGMNGDESLYALCDHESIVFPNPNVGLGRRAAVMVVEVPAHFENQQLVVIERERERIP